MGCIFAARQNTPLVPARNTFSPGWYYQPGLKVPPLYKVVVSSSSSLFVFIAHRHCRCRRPRHPRHLPVPEPAFPAPDAAAEESPEPTQRTFPVPEPEPSSRCCIFPAPEPDAAAEEPPEPTHRRGRGAPEPATRPPPVPRVSSSPRPANLSPAPPLRSTSTSASIRTPSWASLPRIPIGRFAGRSLVALAPACGAVQAMKTSVRGHTNHSAKCRHRRRTCLARVSRPQGLCGCVLRWFSVITISALAARVAVVMSGAARVPAGTLGPKRVQDVCRPAVCV